MDQQKLQILMDKNAPWDVNKAAILDQVTLCTLGSDAAKINQSNVVLQGLYQDAQFWMNIDKIMTLCTHPRTKFFALVILQNAIKVKWQSLSIQQKEGVRNYVVHIVMNISEQQNIDKDMQDILKKSNSCLVQILKYEWNTSWTNFIQQICQSSSKNMNVCQNNFLILKQLSEQIFDFSKNQMTADQISTLKEKMNSQFTNIFNLCELVLNNVEQLKPPLIKACLDTLHSFLSWIPAIYIYFSDIINKLTLFLSNDYLRLSSLNCLIQIASIPVQSNAQRVDEIKGKLFGMINDALNMFNNILPLNENILILRSTRYRNNPQHFQITCKQIALFLTNMIKQQASWLLINPNQTIIQVIKASFRYMIYLLDFPEQQIFKIIIQFFHHFMKNILGISNSFEPNVPHIYQQYLIEVRNIVCVRMAKPQQVLIVIDETGTPVKQDLANTQNNSFYQTMIEILVFLTKIDWTGMKTYIINKIETQTNQNQFKYDTINSLSWAVGALSGHLPPNQDKPFLIAVLKILLQLCQVKKGKPTKAVIASCIMFVVGQYPQFLRNNWNFLKTVIRKLFQFMKERYQGVMDMACNTFLKICKQTQNQLLAIHDNDVEPYIATLIRLIPEQTQALQTTNQVMLFYEALSHVIAQANNMQTKLIYIKNTLGENLKQFLLIVEQSSQNSTLLQEQQVTRRISNFLKINQILASSIGLSYGGILTEFSNYLNSIYQYYGNTINQLVAQNVHAVNYVNTKRMRNVNKQILRLYKTYINSCSVLNPAQMNSIKQSFVLPLAPMLELFSKSLPELKDPEFISLFTIVFQKLNSVLTPQFISQVMETIFNSALAMITTDFSSYPQIRQTFFEFLKAIIKFNFEQFYNMPGDKFNTSLNCVVWSFKHQLSTFSDLGLDLLLQIFNSMNSNVTIANAFYPKYYLNLMKDLLQVITDGFHKSGLKMQSKLLFILIQVVTKGYVVQKLDENQTQGNAEYIYNYLLNILTGTYVNVSKNDTTQVLTGLFSTDDQKQFRTYIRDYLVLINRFTQVQSKEHSN